MERRRRYARVQGAQRVLAAKHTSSSTSRGVACKASTNEKPPFITCQLRIVELPRVAKHSACFRASLFSLSSSDLARFCSTCSTSSYRLLPRHHGRVRSASA